MKRMLINATQQEELRMAMVDGQNLYDLNIELPSNERKKANIYKGKITRIEPSLEAAFVDYGAERHGFLPLKEISNEYFIKETKSGKRPNIKDVLKEGQEIVIQIDKEERGKKGAALTTFVSLAGRFIVLKPNKSKSGGISRRITGEERDNARNSLDAINIPDQMSVILRTAGIERTTDELEWDLNNLLAIWEAIKTVIVKKEAPFLVYKESNAVLRALRDYLTFDIGEILIDEKKAYDDAKEFISQVMPQNLKKLKYYDEDVPLFTNYQIESQIESAYTHSVDLPSGGSVVIDHTEALVSIDINSAKSTKGSDIEETALATNVESAIEIARQLRLRDLGGLIVIDFIDMHVYKNQREVENQLRKAVKEDRARIQIGKISRFGLLEMSRQRLRPALSESNQLICPRCSGIGSIRSVESLALAILRIIGEEARKDMTVKIIAQLPIEIATYLLNEKRDWVQNIESNHNTKVILVANSGLETPHFSVKRIRSDQADLPENQGQSFDLVENLDEQVIPEVIEKDKAVEIPAVGNAKPVPKPPGKKDTQSSQNLWGLFKNLFESDKEEATNKPTTKKPYKHRAKRPKNSKYKGKNFNKNYNQKNKTKNKPVKKDDSKLDPVKKHSKKKENLTNNKGSKKPQKEKSSEGITSSEKLKQKPQKEKSSEGITSSEKLKQKPQKKKAITKKRSPSKKPAIERKTKPNEPKASDKKNKDTKTKKIENKNSEDRLMPWPSDSND